MSMHMYMPLCQQRQEKDVVSPLDQRLQIVADPPRMWVLGIEPSFFARAFNIFNH